MKKDVLNFEGLYQVDENGNVYSLDKEVNAGIMYHDKVIKKGKQLKPETQKTGYKRVLLISKDNKRCHKLIHRLVAEAFIQYTGINPDGRPIEGRVCINHKDGNRENNSFENLEWCDSTYNNTYDNRYLFIF